MVLVFRKNDYMVIEEAATTLKKDPTRLMIEAGMSIKFFNNIYQNPKTENAYNSVVQADIDLTGKEFEKILSKANAEACTIEMLIVEAVKMYLFMYKDVDETSKLA